MKTSSVQRAFLFRELFPLAVLCGALALLALTGCRAPEAKDNNTPASWTGRFDSPPANVNDPKPGGSDPNAKLPTTPPPEKKEP